MGLESITIKWIQINTTNNTYKRYIQAVIIKYKGRNVAFIKINDTHSYLDDNLFVFIHYPVNADQSVVVSFGFLRYS